MLNGRKVILVCPGYVPAALFAETRRRIQSLETPGVIDEKWLLLLKYPLPSVEANERALITAADRYGYRTFDVPENLGEAGNVNAFLAAKPQPPGTIYIKFDGDALTADQGWDQAIAEVLDADRKIAVCSLGIPELQGIVESQVAGHRVFYHPSMMRYDIAGTDLDFVTAAGGFRTPGTLWGGLEQCIHEELKRRRRRIVYLLDKREAADVSGLEELKDEAYGDWKWANYHGRFKSGFDSYLARPGGGRRLVTAMIAHDEADRYLREVIEQCWTFSDRIVVWDDGSTDSTRALCRRLGCEVHGTPDSRFCTDEHFVRESVYAAAMRHAPDWIYTPDADELVEHPQRMRALMDGSGPYAFDAWHAWGSRDAYRRDGFWKGQRALRMFEPPLDGSYRPFRIHCGSAPASVLAQRHVDPGFRMFHLGYAHPDDPVRKFAHYSMVDPEAAFCPRSHYDSMLLPPTLVDADGKLLAPAAGDSTPTIRSRRVSRKEQAMAETIVTGTRLYDRLPSGIRVLAYRAGARVPVEEYKRLTGAKPPKATEPAAKPLDRMNKAELVTEAKRRGISVDPESTNAQIRAALEDG